MGEDARLTFRSAGAVAAGGVCLLGGVSSACAEGFQIGSYGSISATDLYIAVGFFVAGALVVLILSWATRRPPDWLGADAPLPPNYLPGAAAFDATRSINFIIGCFTLVVLVAAAKGDINLARAAGAIIAGGGALIAIRRLLVMFAMGEAFEVQSHWGGLGGGLGGWRISSAAVLSFVVVVLVGGTFALLATPPVDKPGGEKAPQATSAASPAPAASPASAPAATPGAAPAPPAAPAAPGPAQPEKPKG